MDKLSFVIGVMAPLVGAFIIFILGPSLLFNALLYCMLVRHWCDTGQWKLDGPMPRKWRGKHNTLSTDMVWRQEHLGTNPWKE